MYRVGTLDGIVGDCSYQSHGSIVAVDVICFLQIMSCLGHLLCFLKKPTIPLSPAPQSRRLLLGSRQRLLGPRQRLLQGSHFVLCLYIPSMDTRETPKTSALITRIRMDGWNQAYSVDADHVNYSIKRNDGIPRAGTQACNVLAKHNLC